MFIIYFFKKTLEKINQMENDNNTTSKLEEDICNTNKKSKEVSRV